ncbi:MAG: glycosyltransferase, partial [Solobacterium sp.]|nr:glycosyltransferase [Solobacterium sp.]
WIISWVGGFLTVIMLVFLLVLLVLSLLGKALSSTVLIIAVVLFMGGIILLSTGILGEYLAKTYDEVRGRPNYIIRKFYE